MGLDLKVGSLCGSQVSVSKLGPKLGPSSIVNIRVGYRGRVLIQQLGINLSVESHLGCRVPSLGQVLSRVSGSSPELVISVRCRG